MTTLSDLRKQSGKTPIEVANMLRVSLQSVYRYERGESRINIQQVLLLSELYGCSEHDVIEAQLNSCLSVR